MYSTIIIFTITLSLFCGQKVLGNGEPGLGLSQEQILQEEMALVEYLEEPLDINDEDQKRLFDIIVNRDNVMFFLYTKDDKNKKFVTDDVQQFPVEYENYIFLVHGWASSRNTEWYSGMTETILKGQNNAVVQVDWSIPSKLTYVVCKKYALQKVSGYLADFIIKLHQELNIPLEKVTILGHSLGAHVAGIAGKDVFQALNSKLGKIVGADPAGPLFTSTDERRKLNKNDAECVTVLHTDAGYLGYRYSLGALDFFPNEGTRIQPGCRISLNVNNDNATGDSYGIIADIQNLVGCSHMRAPLYIIEAFSYIWGEDKEGTKSFESFGEIKSKLLLALSGNCSAGNGDYYFTTNAESPFLK